MDVLDNYKKAWENQPDETHKVSKVDIYKMTQQNSSSIVKWIFIIGILEFAFWLALNYFSSSSKYTEIYKKINLDVLMKVTTYLHYAVILVFLYVFYKNYTAISITDNTKQLIQKILRVRKTVKLYVFYNLITIFVISVIVNWTIFNDKTKFMLLFDPENISINDATFFRIMLLSQIAILVVFLVLLWLFYQLLYGILLRKLNKNYKELSKLDELK